MNHIRYVLWSTHLLYWLETVKFIIRNNHPSLTQSSVVLTQYSDGDGLRQPCSSTVQPSMHTTTISKQDQQKREFPGECVAGVVVQAE